MIIEEGEPSERKLKQIRYKTICVHTVSVIY